jgi:tetratricopeptide (TPR) repeat protein
MKRRKAFLIVSIIILSTPLTTNASTNELALFKPNPFQSEALQHHFHSRWVVLLAQGPEAFPESCQLPLPMPAGAVDQEKMVNDAYVTIKSLISPLSSHLNGRRTLDDDALYNIVHDAKRAQFLLQQTTIRYTSVDFLPSIEWQNDPTLQVVMEFLSTLGIHYIINKTMVEGFSGFNTLDLKLLNASKAYAHRAILAFEKIVAMSEDQKVKTWLKRDYLSTAYNNFGSALAFLGDADAAKVAFQKALVCNPDNLVAQSNILDLPRLGAFIRVGGPSSRTP